MKFKEIERTYICKKLDNLLASENSPRLYSEYDIFQHILIKNDNTEIRLREYVCSYTNIFHELTIKNGHGNIRDEVNLDLSDYEYRALRPIEKPKHKRVIELEADNYTLYYNNVDNGKLYYIDVEFTNEEEMKKFNIYDYIPKEYIIEEVDKTIPKEYIKEEEN